MRCSLATVLLLVVITPTVVWLNFRERVEVSRPFDLGLGTPLVDVQVASGWPFNHRSCIYLVTLVDLDAFHDWLRTDKEARNVAYQRPLLILNLVCSSAVVASIAIAPELAMRLLAYRRPKTCS